MARMTAKPEMGKPASKGFFIVSLLEVFVEKHIEIEISKFSSFVGALLASLPLVSVLAIYWIYIDTSDVNKISTLTSSIFWLVLPSLSLFIILPILLKAQVPFHISMVIGLIVMSTLYFLMVYVLDKFGINL